MGPRLGAPPPDPASPVYRAQPAGNLVGWGGAFGVGGEGWGRGCARLALATAEGCREGAGAEEAWGAGHWRGTHEWLGFGVTGVGA